MLNPGVTNPLKLGRVRHLRRHEPRQAAATTRSASRSATARRTSYPQANAAAGRTDVYTKFTSIAAPAAARCSRRPPRAPRPSQLDSVTGYAVGDTINVDTGDGGSRLESRTVTAVGTNTLTVRARAEPARTRPASQVLGSGAPTKPEMAVTPRLIARLELTYADGTHGHDRHRPVFRAKDGPTITDNWYAGTDFDARAVQPGWDEPGADLSAAKGWEARQHHLAAVAARPSSCGARRRRCACRRRSSRSRSRRSRSGSWSFDLGQNFAGMPRLHINGGRSPRAR